MFFTLYDHKLKGPFATANSPIVMAESKVREKKEREREREKKKRER